MKKLFTFLAIACLVAQVPAQTGEYLQHKDFQVEKKKIYDGINASKKQLIEIKKTDAKIRQSIDSLKQIVSVSAGQLSLATDSLSKTSMKLHALQEKVDSHKVLSMGVRILLLVIILLLFAILFVMIFLIKKNVDLHHQSFLDLDKKTHERIDQEIKNLNLQVQRGNDRIDVVSDEMSRRISEGLNTVEARGHHIEQQMKENLAVSEGRIEAFGMGIGKLRQEQHDGTKVLGDNLSQLKKAAEEMNRLFAERIGKLEGEVKK